MASNPAFAGAQPAFCAREQGLRESRLISWWSFIRRPVFPPSQATLQQTLTLALAEAAAFPVNAISLSSDTEYLVMDFFSMQEVLVAAGMDMDHTRVLQKAAGNNLPQGAGSMIYVIPNQSTPQAFWSVDGDTGDVLSLLLDGSGGSALTCQDDQLTRETAAANLLQNFAGLMGLLPPGIGSWISLGLTMRLIAERAALILGTMGDPNVDAEELQRLSDKLQEDLKDMIMGLAKEGLSQLPQLPGLGDFNTGDSIGSDIGKLTRPRPEGC